MDISQYDDRGIVEAMLARNTRVTKEYLYRRCYPLFRSIFDRYYTDCDSCLEFINEIYLFIMVPRQSSGISRLAGFGFKCTLTMWLKIVSENYCRQLFSRRGEIFTESLDSGDRKQQIDESLIETIGSAGEADVRIVLASMSNVRYRKLIEYRYVDERSNEETASLLGLTMANYYNAHKRAKEQFCACLRKEGLI